ncbi:uncharacterized protein LOC103505570 [Diaphorina citri]|uniref:Uncharacterized protein LOC103505570 n=1 Tax=Diaphorina citri TaxID=121845 RepID=A0A1S3CVX1_DIACI|nr:uncharacterized protein LOC103505570 [Diaphorina citri]KAI5702687.1 hypothetical protein M8J75_003035 [Diaphorina citri]KAI5732889.1 hypothetical protein M8J76_005356 [Diaphorina citri]KAI5738369.1 hypothetical protein M8J77_006079 [Diaphorina citri]
MESKNKDAKKYSLSVLLAKVVGCTKIEDGVTTKFGVVGAAIWGSNNHKFYELVLYKQPKDDYVSRICINRNFRFNIDSEDTASAFIGDKIQWVLNFTSGGDLREFAIHVGLARWIVSDMKSALTQEVHVMKLPDEEEDVDKVLSEHGDYIEIYYVAKVVTKDQQFGAEVANNTNDGRPLGLKIGTEWDKGLIGATPGSKRLIIIPHQSLGIWKCLVPNFQHLSLLVKIQRFGKSESDFNIWTPIATPGPSIPSQVNSRACRPGLITQLFKHGQTPPMRGAVNRKLFHLSQPFGIEQNLSIHPYKLLQFSRSLDMNDNLTLALFETLTQMKVCNSKVKEFCTQLQIKNTAVREKIENALKSNLKIIHELEENFMEINERRNVDEYFMDHPDTAEDKVEKLGDETELNNYELNHPFEKTQPEVRIFTCESSLPDIAQLTRLERQEH